jgi:Integrase zinc binding domain
LLGGPIIVRTDHSSLQWLRKTPEPVAQQARWLNFIKQFNYVIEHRAGAKHNNADALSRIPHPCKHCTHCSKDENNDVHTEDGTGIHVAVRSSKNTQNLNVDPFISGPSSEEIARLQYDDPDIDCIVKLRLQSDEQPSIEALQSASETTKILWSQWYRSVVRDGVVYRLWFSERGKPSRLLLLAPKTLREDIIKNARGGMSGGHMGIAKTCQQIQRRAFWLGWRRDVVHFCHRCDECCRYHRGQLPKRALLQPIIAGAPFERLSIDLTGPHCRTPRGSVYILTMSSRNGPKLLLHQTKKQK